jgi:hypothetical protein
VALPGPEEQAPAKGHARPAIGPIVPLNVTTGGEGGDLLGAGGVAAQHESDPVAARVLSRGEAVAAPHGRADDFSWPRPDAGAAADLTPALVAAPPAPAGKGAAHKNDTKSDAAKTDARKSSEAKNDKNTPPNPAPNAALAKRRRAGSALYGAPPRPPLPLGASRD